MERKSAKAKGRRFEKEIASLFINKGVECRTVPSSCNGEDIIFDEPQPFSCEIKCQEKLNIWSALEQAAKNAKDKQPILFFKRNRSKTYAVVNAEWLLELIFKENK